MLQIESVDESGFNEELLLESGYEFQALEFRLLSPEDSRKARNGEGRFNRNCSRAPNLESLVSDVERNSTVVRKYIREDFKQEQDEKLAESISKIIRQFESPGLSSPPSELEEYINAEKEASAPSEQDDMPRKVYFPCPVRLDASEVREFEFIEDTIGNYGYEVNGVSISVSSRSMSAKNRAELDEGLNYPNMSISFGDQDLFSNPSLDGGSAIMPEFTYLNYPEGGGWRASNIKDDNLIAEVFEGLEERGYAVNRSWHEGVEGESAVDGGL